MQVYLSGEVVDKLKKIIAENGLSTIDEAVLLALDEYEWSKQFIEHPQVLDRLGAEIESEIAAGRAEDMDIDALMAENTHADQMQQGDIPLTGDLQDNVW